MPTNRLRLCGLGASIALLGLLSLPGAIGCSPQSAGSVWLGERGDCSKGITHPKLLRTHGGNEVQARLRRENPP
jgi:hypothetical protein